MIDFSTIYCSATGRPIAQIDDSELGILIETCPSNVELETRCLLSMRPSTIWMSITPDSLEHLRIHAPRQLLAYLMNRLYAAPERQGLDKTLNLENRLNMLRSRVQMWTLLESWIMTDEELQQILLLLLELDARFNLPKLILPAGIPSVWLATQSLHRKSWLDAIVDWHEKLIAKALKDSAQAKASAEWWSEGSKLARLAYTKAFLVTKPLSRTAEKKAAKAKEMKLLDGLLDSLFAAEEEIYTAPIQPKVNPIAIAKASGGIKFGVKS